MTSRAPVLALASVLGIACGCSRRHDGPKASPVKGEMSAASSGASASSSASTVPAPTSPDAFASVKVTSDRHVYKGGSLVVELPVVSGVPDPAVEKNVNAMLTPQELLGESIADIEADVKSGATTGLQGAGFEVPFQHAGILEIRTFSEWMGAYPSGDGRILVVDLQTGKKIGAESFVPALMPKLVATLDKELRAELKTASPDAIDSGLLDGAHFEATDLAIFEVDDDGVAFLHDYQFPHALLGAAPPGRFPLPWSRLEPYLDPASPLRRLAKP